MTDRIFNVLVLCSGNSARSIMGEGLFNYWGKGAVRAYSAGSKPAGKVNPLALDTLAKHGISVADARSKSWDEFNTPDASRFDFIINVCDNAANEPCPYWSGHPTTAHWGIPDPAHVEPLEARRIAFEQACQQLESRILAFVALPLVAMSTEQVQEAARQIHLEGLL